MKELVVAGSLVVTMDRDRRILKDAAVAIRDGLITGVGPRSDILTRFPRAQVVGIPRGIVLPGFICTHSHMAGVIAHNLPLPPKGKGFMDLLTKWWWPYVEDQAEKEDIETGARFAALRMLKSGTTCVADMVETPFAGDDCLEVLALALEEAGIRGVVGLEVSDRLGPDVCTRLLELNARFLRDNDRGRLVQGCSAVHTAYTCNKDTLRRAKELANRYSAPLLIHIAEIPPELLIEKYGVTAVEYLNQNDFLGPEVLAAHCIHLSSSELETLADHDVKVSHTPMTNMRGGHGVAPVPDMLELGMTVSLGHDAFFDFDMVECMRIANLLHKIDRRDRSVISAAQSLEMLTIGAARAIGCESSLGSLEEGKRGDLVVLKEMSPAPVDERTFPSYFLTDLSGADVSTVVVDGTVVVEQGTAVYLDEDDVINACQERALRLWHKVGAS